MKNIKTLQRKYFPISFDEENAYDRKLAESNKGKSEKLNVDFTKFQIPFYDWNIRFRKTIEGHPNVLKYLPMWHAIYRDETPFIMLAIARQLGKTTWAGGLLAYYGTQPHKKGVYVTFSDESLRSFSNDKYRGSILHPDNPEIFETIRGGDNSRGAVSRVEFLTDSSTSLVTDAGDMHHVEGKSADILILDEDQNLNLDAYFKAKESQAWTQGKTIFTGIGGYLGTEHHKTWMSTNQMEWKPAHEFWRDGLQYNQDGLIWDEYLIDLLAGEWIAKAPQNWTRHGYHLTQEMFPNIPLTKKDAVEKYHKSEDVSIEYKREKYPNDYYQRHVLANFVKGQQKPFTKEMLYKLLDRTLHFTPPDKVNRSLGKLYASTDWGGGTNAFTVPLITQCIHPSAPIFRVLYISRIDEKDVEKQADQFINLCDAYEVDKIAIDAGGGPRQAQKVSKYYGGRCTTVTYQARPELPLPSEQERQRLDRDNRFTIDRTYSIDILADLMSKPFQQGNYSFPRFILPGADLDKFDWMIENFEAEEGELVQNRSTGQWYIRYDHDSSKPDDALHSFNYNWIAQYIDQGSDVWLKSF